MIKKMPNLTSGLRLSKVVAPFVLLMPVLHAPVQAATEIEWITERTVDGETSTMITHGIHQGDRMKYTFRAPEDAEAGKGDFFVSTDGGHTIHYIDSKDSSCLLVQQRELSSTLSRYLLETSKKFNISASDLHIEQVLEQPAESRHGFDTQHKRYQVDFKVHYKYMLFKGHYDISRSVDVWMTQEQNPISSSPMFQRLWQYTGESELDTEIRKAAGDVPQLRLRSEIEQTRTDKKGKQSSLRLVSDISRLQEIEDLPDDRFDTPECETVSPEQMEKKFNGLLKDLLG